MNEKTLCIIKPDAVANNYVEEINEMISSKDLIILNSVKTKLSKEIAVNFFAEHSK